MSEIARGYVRLSGTDSERSIPSQKKDIKEYCEGHDELELDFIYDEGKDESGWDASREEYQQMLSDASEGEFDVLVVRSGSRIGRDKIERLDTYMDLANKYDVEFHTCSRGYVDPSNPTDLLMEVFEATKDDEKKQEIERAKDTIQQRQEEGYYQGASPWGLTHQSDASPPGLVPTSEFDTVLRVYELMNEDISYRDIIEQLDLDKSTSSISRLVDDDRTKLYKRVCENEDIEFPQLD